MFYKLQIYSILFPLVHFFYNIIFFISGKGNKPYISLPKGKGLKLSIAEERDKRLAQKS